MIILVTYIINFDINFGINFDTVLSKNLPSTSTKIIKIKIYSEIPNIKKV